MTISLSILLGFVQGITEFLPISSSGHLALFEIFFGADLDLDNILSFDVILHFGSLTAIFIYFHKDIRILINEFFLFFNKNYLTGVFSITKFFAAKLNQSKIGIQTSGAEKFRNLKTHSVNNKLITKLFIATLPAVITGAFIGDYLDNYSHSLNFLGVTFALSGLYFLFSEKIFLSKKITNEINLKNSLIIGISQIFAIAPGISRAGTTLSTGLLLGINREDAIRFSFLMGAPIILAANTYIIIKNGASLENLGITPVIVGFLTSFIFSIISIHYLISFFSKHTLKGFAWYLIGLSLIMLYV